MQSLKIDVSQVDLRESLRGFSFLWGDPCCRQEPGSFERATLTPEGPGSIKIEWNASGAEVSAWGDGKDWLLENARSLLGVDDNISTFDPRHKFVRRIYGQFPRLRIGGTKTVWHDLAWLILQQRVSTKEASWNWKALVTTWGQPAPGPGGLLLPPESNLVARKNYTDFHALGIERKRATYLISAAKAASRLQEIVDLPSDKADQRLQSVPGIGPWTAGYVVATTLGNADAIIPGDYNLPSTVAWVLAGEARANDARMFELLEPFAGHRWRVCRLMMAAGLKAPRRGHRQKIMDIRRV